MGSSNKKSRYNTVGKTTQEIVEVFSSKIKYSRKYEDANYQYRNVTLPQEIATIRSQRFGASTLLKEADWRFLRVMGGPGWECYATYTPQPHILLMRRPLSVARQYDGPQDANRDEIEELRRDHRVYTLRSVP